MTLKNIKEIELQDSQILNITYNNTGKFQEWDNLPSYCSVLVESRPSNSSSILTEIWLPQDWNGIFVATGNGGLAGTIWHWSLAKYVKRGYAVCNTDMGTQDGKKRGINNPEIWKDFGWRSTYLMTVVAKQIITAYYGRKPTYSYFVGESTGGQQALTMAQRFPREYDGIVSGVPAYNRVRLHTAFVWNWLHLMKEGKPVFEKEDIEFIVKNAAEFFQLHGDGEKGDHFITYPWLGEDTNVRFINFLRTKGRFCESQLKALKAYYDGPVNPKTGERIYCGVPIGAEDCIFGGIKDTQQEECHNFYPFLWVFGEDYTGKTFDFDKDLETVEHILGSDLNATNPDLTEFKMNGGKLIMYSGSEDAIVPYPEHMNYYECVANKMGGVEKTLDFFQYYLVPGKDHNVRGKGANVLRSDMTLQYDMLDMVRMWRESNIVPDSIVAARYSDVHEWNKLEFARRIYPYGSEQNPFREHPPVTDLKEGYVLQKVLN